MGKTFLSLMASANAHHGWVTRKLAAARDYASDLLAQTREFPPAMITTLEKAREAIKFESILANENGFITLKLPFKDSDPFLPNNRDPDVLLNTDLSVDRLATLEQEQFLCPSHVDYAKPLRAVNTHGKWSTIVNNIPASYDHLTQTVRIEKCKNEDYPCPLIPSCYGSKCVQKYTYHRFLVYNPKDYYYPFRVESFKLPSSCDCITSEYHYYDHLNSKDPYTGAKTVKSYRSPKPVEIIQDYVKQEIIKPIYYPKTESSSKFEHGAPPHYIEQRLIHSLLQSEGVLHGVQSTSPLGGGGLGDVMEDNLATSHVLVLDELVGVIMLLICVLAEELGKSLQGHVVSVEGRMA
eukprot:maker-scaffold1052_size66809-snap-gene-0.14 protein:Tk03045 transcript:maker-scaffold1052_size66809-snap-gene-0.14-mRNA-1 annotation:"Spz3"